MEITGKFGGKPIMQPVSALSKISFPMTRLYKDIDYIFKRYSAPSWLGAKHNHKRGGQALLSGHPPGQRFSQTLQQEPVGGSRPSSSPNRSSRQCVAPRFTWSTHYSHQSIRCDTTINHRGFWRDFFPGKSHICITYTFPLLRDFPPQSLYIMLPKQKHFSFIFFF